MKKLLFLPILYFIFSIFSMSAQAGIVEMKKNNIPNIFKNYSNSVVCNISGGSFVVDSSINNNDPDELVKAVLEGIDKGLINDAGNDAVEKLFSNMGNFSGKSGDAFNNIAYCVANEKFDSAIFDGPYSLSDSPQFNINKDKCGTYPGRCDIIIHIGDKNFLTAQTTKKTCTSIRVKGSNIKSNGVMHISGLNSPFLYSQNSSYQNLQITINSAFNNYQNQAPAFNNSNGWQVTAENNHFIVNNKPQKHLFYELAMNKVILNRNGQNFTSKQDLTNYLQNSDFFNNLGLNETQKNNSLNYILPILPDTKNYYLTILSSKSIEDISNLEINPPVKTARVYYAIYPTNTVVKTNGDLIFPQINQITEANLLEAGEILVKPEMFVLWE